MCIRDRTVTLPDGGKGFMPGVIANAYEQLGGAVTYYGKPHAPAFDAALRMLGPDVEPARVLHVGDSLLHDVAGANAAGIHSLFIGGGIHASELGIADAAASEAEPAGGAAAGGDADGADGLQAAALEKVFARYGCRPTMSASAFRW